MCFLSFLCDQKRSKYTLLIPFYPLKLWMNKWTRVCMHWWRADREPQTGTPENLGVQYLAEWYLSRTLCLPVPYWLNYHCPIWPLESNLINANLFCGAVRLFMVPNWALVPTWTDRLLTVCVWCFSPLGESLCCHWSTVLGMPCYHMSMLRDGPKGLWGEQSQQLIRSLFISIHSFVYISHTHSSVLHSRETFPTMQGCPPKVCRQKSHSTSRYDFHAIINQQELPWQ